MREMQLQDVLHKRRLAWHFDKITPGVSGHCSLSCLWYERSRWEKSYHPITRLLKVRHREHRRSGASERQCSRAYEVTPFTSGTSRIRHFTL